MTCARLSQPLRPADVRDRRAFGAAHSWAARTADIAVAVGLDAEPLDVRKVA